MLKNIKGAIFDMDGTLIDSMWIWNKIDEEYLKKRSIPLPKDLKEKIAHLSFNEVAQYFKDRFNIIDSIEEIQKEWYDMAIHEYTYNVTLKPGAKEFLYALKKKRVKIALATSNSRLLTEIALKQTGIYNFFDSISITDEVSRGKDFPDIYLLAASRLGLKPEDCVVFEDILPAVKGAKLAKMTVVGVHDLYSDYQKTDIANHADMYIFQYDEITKAV